MILSALLGVMGVMLPGADAELPEALTVTEADVFAALDLDRPGLEALKEAVADDDLAAAREAWAEYMRARETPTLHFSRDMWADFIRAEMPQLVEPFIRRADRIVHHELKHGPYHMPLEGDAIQWLSNPTRDSNYVSVVGSQWLLNPLGRAYLLTGDERYAEAFVWFFGSWFEHRQEIEERKGGIGIPPIYHAYYPGIRCRVLLDNYYCLARSPALTAEVQMKLMRELLGAARWVHNRNESFYKGNQPVGAVLGPALVALFFPEFRESEAWLAQATARMREHLERDFFPDGGHMELCTQYHKTVLRDVAFVGLTQMANGLPSFFEGESGKLLARAYDWLAAIVMPTGETPPLHSAVFSTDWTIHLTIGARFLDRPDWWWLARRELDKGLVPSQKSPLSLAAMLICEQLSRQKLARLEPKQPSYESIHLDTSGFAVMRTGWEPDDTYMVFQYGWANTGHAYPGALSFLLEMNGEVVATHPGSPRSYRHPAYRYCHSTRSHNVVSIDNASYTPKGGIAPGGHVHHLADVEGAWYVHAYHEGYEPPFGVVHERQILALKDGPIIWLDHIIGGAGHTARWHFHTPLDVKIGENKVAHISGNGQYLLIPAQPEKIADVELEQHWMAVLPRDCQPDDCGKVVPALAYVQPVTESGAMFAVALIEVTEGAFRRVSTNTFEVRTPGVTYLLGFGPAECEPASADAACWCVRFDGEEPVEAWVFQGTELQVGGTTWLDSAEPVDARLTRP